MSFLLLLLLVQGTMPLTTDGKTRQSVVPDEPSHYDSLALAPSPQSTLLLHLLLLRLLPLLWNVPVVVSPASSLWSNNITHLGPSNGKGNDSNDVKNSNDLLLIGEGEKMTWMTEGWKLNGRTRTRSTKWRRFDHGCLFR